MKRVGICLLTFLILLTLTACGGVSREKHDELVGSYNELKVAYENCGASLRALGVTDDSDLGTTYGEWGEAISDLANEINNNIGAMTQEEADAVIARIDQIFSTVEQTQMELDDMLEVLDVSGYWEYGDESGASMGFEQGKVYFYDAQGELTDEGSYRQDGIYVTITLGDSQLEGITDGSMIVFGEGSETFTMNFVGLLKD